MNRVLSLYYILLKKYGKQGWWPVIRRSRSIYNPGDYTAPANPAEQFQIVAGAILAQNTNWKNAEKALLSLHSAKMLSAGKLAAAPKNKIAKLIRSSGYYNQKAERLKTIAKKYGKLKKLKNPAAARKFLLAIKGIGPETADSILLYAFKKPVFVIDAYTRRFCKAHRLFESKDYEHYRKFFEESLPKDYRIYNEYHALIVQWGKDNK